MRITIGFFAFLFLCFMLAASIAPSVVATGWFEVEPHRVMSRLAQFIMLMSLWPLLSALALTNRDALGYGISARKWWRNVLCGESLGVTTLLVLVLALLVLQIRVPDAAVQFWSGIVGKTVQALFGGLLIGLIEETFFRGAVYSAIRRRDGVRTAVIGSALLYAAVHFLKPGALPVGMTFDSTSAWLMFGQTFTDALRWQHLDSFSALFCCGILLALVRERSGHIGWCVGIHAGWVLVIQLTRWLTDGNSATPFASFVGNYDGIIGWLAALWIGVLIMVYRWLMPNLMRTAK
ncbi:CPBP family intramembrane glutamic endopeptidase [Chromatium okenii]|uniref:CPBP family intramembrane metalloprotease domain-containing protein n=1 Tax=Chromatium okenii TaxID=61644 RepID=A0A2S7XSH0_9GAMM|nr:CPBP family intramembrane glutamic endopeptidase [Chromatium okenii]PQJ96694.1 CPBP family intramembrane metalloprotease domain-containing protein [Chromatium okenii]